MTEELKKAEFKGWCDALEKIAGCIEGYPNMGGDIRVMTAVDNLLQKQKELYYGEFIAQRGVEVPCKKCGGFGVCCYSLTSTWRGGVGGMSITPGVCDKCWGSGDENRHWPDWRKYVKDGITK